MSIQQLTGVLKHSCVIAEFEGQVFICPLHFLTFNVFYSFGFGFQYVNYLFEICIINDKSYGTFSQYIKNIAKQNNLDLHTTF
jgi:hypothetical protein